MCIVEDSDTQEAKRLYDSFGTHLARFNEYQNQYLFGDCYNSRTDRVFVYESFFSKKYILERFRIFTDGIPENKNSLHKNYSRRELTRKLVNLITV